MDASDALFEDRRVPRQVHVYQRRRMLKIEARAAGIRGQEHAAGGIGTEALDQRWPFLRWHAAVESDMADPTCFETAADDVVSPRPLGEYHRLGFRFGEQSVQPCRQFVGLDTVIGLLVQQI